MIRSEISSWEKSYELENWLRGKTDAGLVEEVKSGTERGDEKRSRVLYHIEGSRIVVVSDRYVPYNEEVRAEPRIKEELTQAGIISPQTA
ncbi:MAG: hypothetical protein AAB675_03510 [Patescibacteria group bacterium]